MYRGKIGVLLLWFVGLAVSLTFSPPVMGNNPLSIALVRFEGYRSLEGVRLEWETASERDTVGYFLFRSDEENGEEVLNTLASDLGSRGSWSVTENLLNAKKSKNVELINQDEMINSSGSVTKGATYSMIDNEVVAGNTYFYLLVEIENDGSLVPYSSDILKYQVSDIRIWFVVLISACAAVGVLLYRRIGREGPEAAIDNNSHPASD